MKGKSARGGERGWSGNGRKIPDRMIGRRGPHLRTTRSTSARLPEQMGLKDGCGTVVNWAGGHTDGRRREQYEWLTPLTSVESPARDGRKEPSDSSLGESQPSASKPQRGGRNGANRTRTTKDSKYAKGEEFGKKAEVICRVGLCIFPS